MTVIRRKALQISSWVSRWASPGSKEWAEGLEREIEFIESDWRALAWSLGSVRVLLDRRRMSPTLNRGIRPKSPSMAEISTWIIIFSLCLPYMAGILKPTARWDRFDGCLVGILLGCWAATSVMHWRRERWAPSNSGRADSMAYLLFARESLEIELARSSTVRRWLQVFAGVSLVTDAVVKLEGGMHLMRIASELAMLAFGWLVRLPQTPANIQRQIERMDKRIAEAQQVGVKRAHSDHWGRPQTPKTESHPAEIQSQIEPMDEQTAESGR